MAGWRPAMVSVSSHSLLQVLINLIQEAFRRQPFLVGADEQRQILGHVTLLHGRDTDFFHGMGELGELVIAVQLGAMGETPRPGKDRSDGIGRSALALLVFAI